MWVISVKKRGAKSSQIHYITTIGNSGNSTAVRFYCVNVTSLRKKNGRRCGSSVDRWSPLIVLSLFLLRVLATTSYTYINIRIFLFLFYVKRHHSAFASVDECGRTSHRQPLWVSDKASKKWLIIIYCICKRNNGRFLQATVLLCRVGGGDGDGCRSLVQLSAHCTLSVSLYNCYTHYQMIH